MLIATLGHSIAGAFIGSFVVFIGFSVWVPAIAPRVPRLDKWKAGGR